MLFRVHVLIIILLFRINVSLALDSFPSQSIILHLDLLTFPREEIQISLVFHFTISHQEPDSFICLIFFPFFFLAIMQQIANVLQSQSNTISIEYNSFIHIQGKKEEIKGKARRPYFSEPRPARVRGGRSAPRTASSLPAVPWGCCTFPAARPGQ